MRISFVFVFLISAATAWAQDSYQGMDLDTAMEMHSGITAGWLIGKRCKLFTPEELSELEKNRGVIKANLGRSWNPAYFPAEEQAAAEVAGEKPYSDCGRDAKQAVREAVQFARDWAAEITAGSSTR
jgi:hypothetical protein